LSRSKRPPIGCFLIFPIILAILAGYWLFRGNRASVDRTLLLLDWLRDPIAYPEWSMRAGEFCGDGPFRMPTSGYIAYLWDDSFKMGHRHQGIDIFGGSDVGIIPVYAAYPGYLSRPADWKSSLIIRIPDDPLRHGRQIWTYYTHMADSDGNSYIVSEFPPGTHEVYIEPGTLLGYQGNYSGDPGNPVGVHLHFSIVLDNGQGSYLNELEINNTLDPSPYFGMPLNARTNPGQALTCP
jgi:murein DD-endopeptidase MepM/ murein hydrolase activator NlpD